MLFRSSGRPVLVVPQGFSGMVGKRILFAWNGSTESARAISLAMPVLSGAESIDVLSVDGAMVPGPSSSEIAESLRSHGLNVTSQHVKPGSRSAGQTIVDETDWKVSDVKDLADVVHNFRDIGASLASGSYRTEGMIVAPCSIKTLSGIVNSYDDNLLTRAADVVLKEKRRLVLLVREAPFHLGHLELMSRAAQYGAVVMPPVPAFYAKIKTLDGMVDHTVGRVLDLFGMPSKVNRWQGIGNDAIDG